MKKTFIYLSIMAIMASCSIAETEKAPQTPVVAGETIQLQTPSKQGGASINEALWNRKSSRDYANEPLTLEELSGVLWAAAGYAENVNLYTAANGLKSITRGGAKAEQILELLQLDPARYSFTLAQTVGK